MKCRLQPTLILLAFAGFAFLTGCAAAPQSSANSAAPAAQSDSAAPDIAPSATGAIPNDVIAPPPGALYTILCRSFDSPAHVSEAIQLKNILIQHTGDKNWYCVHNETESDLYYGYYQTYDDRSQIKEFNRAHADRDKIATLLDDVGNPLFPGVIFQPISLPDPPAPKEWDLKSNHGYWTLIIGTYRDNPLRKQAAVDCVKELRAKGWEAYFQHTADASNIFIGSWPRSAIKEQDQSIASSPDPNKSIVVLAQPLRPDQDVSKIVGPDGRPAQVFVPKLDIQDATLKNAMTTWPYTLINGVAMGVQHSHGSQVMPVIPYPSAIVQVPHDEDQVGLGDQSNPQSPTAAPSRDPMIPVPSSVAPPP